MSEGSEGSERTRQVVRWSDLPVGAQVAPSLYAADLLVLGRQIDALLDAGVRVFHVDIGDGRFIDPIIFGDVIVEAVAQRVHPRGGLVDCHMMVAEPEHHIARIAAAGGDSFTFHLEATDDPSRTLATVRAAGLETGVAANPDTPIAELVGPATDAEVALCMGVHPGLSGQDFIPATVGRVAELHRHLPGGGRIQVDGGVGGDNIAALHQAGAQVFVGGSSIFWGDDPSTGYRSLCAHLAGR